MKNTRVQNVYNLINKYSSQGEYNSILNDEMKQILLTLLFHPSKHNYGKAIKLTKEIYLNILAINIFINFYNTTMMIYPKITNCQNINLTASPKTTTFKGKDCHCNTNNDFQYTNKLNDIFNDNVKIINRGLAEDPLVRLFIGANNSSRVSKRKDFVISDIVRVLKEAKNLDLNSGSLLKLRYSKGDMYDFPLRFATACYNSRNKGQEYIFNNTPPIFQNIDQKELLQKLDILSISLRSNNDSYSSNSQISHKEITISGKTFYIKPLNSDSAECFTYVISDSEDNDKNSVIYKVYKLPAEYGINVGSLGFYGNIGMLREANMAGVSDVPDLYYANPIIKSCNSDISKYTGAWTITENANFKKIDNGLKLQDWLSCKGLKCFDDKPAKRINGVCVDLGLILPNCGATYDDPYGNNLVNDIYSNYVKGKSTADILDLIK